MTPITFRGSQWKFVVGLTTMLFAGIVVMGIVFGAADRHDEGQPPFPLALRIVFIVAAVVAAVAIWRFWRAKVVIGDDGLTVVNVVHTHVIAWSSMRTLDATFRADRGGGLGKVAIGTNQNDVPLAAAAVNWSSRVADLAPLVAACEAHGVLCRVR